MSRYIGMFRLYPKPGSSEDGFIVNDKNVVKHSILHLLKTHKGSRVYDPDYGTNLHKLIFEPNIQRTRNIAKTEIESVIKKYEPRAQLLSVESYAGQRELISEVVIIVRVLYVEYGEEEDLELRMERDEHWVSDEGTGTNPIDEWMNKERLQ